MTNDAKRAETTPLTSVSWMASSSTSPQSTVKKSKLRYDLTPIELGKLMFNAKIDYVRIETPGHCELPTMEGHRKWGVAAHYKELTIHDPSVADLAVLIKIFGQARVLALEVAVDVRPKSAESAPERAELLERVMIDLFARCLEPSRGEGMLNRFRAYFRASVGSPQPFERRLPRATDQLLYGHRDESVQVKCYFKKRDQLVDLPIDQHVARVEVRIDAPVLQSLSVYTLGDLRDFDFRKALMPYFTHVQGTARLANRKLKTKGKMREAIRAHQEKTDSELWARHGVGGFLQGGIGGAIRDRVRFVQFTKVNNRIGQALMRLGRQHAKNSVCRR